jgi:capsular polysaccharide biosynthesis protein
MELKQVIRLLKSRMRTIALAVLIGTGAAGAYSVFFIEPVYEASTELILTGGALGREADYNALLANGMLIDTYRDIVRTPRLMSKVVQAHPELNRTASDLLAVVISTTTNNQIMSIVVRDHSYEQARRIANAVSEIMVREIPVIMHMDNIALLNPAPEFGHPSPVKPSHTVNAAIGFIFSLLLSVGIVLLREHLRDDIRSAAEIETLTGLRVLVSFSRMKKSEAYPVIRSITEEKARERIDVATEQ